MCLEAELLMCTQLLVGCAGNESYVNRKVLVVYEVCGPSIHHSLEAVLKILKFVKFYFLMYDEQQDDKFYFERRN